MPIERAINQPKFRNEWEKATVNILFTSSWINEKNKVFFEDFDLTPQQFNVLRILRGSKPFSLSALEIKNRMLDRNSDVSRIIERLCVKKLARKKVKTKDKRLLEVNITLKGIKLLYKIDERENELDATLDKLNEEEAKTLNALLDKIRIGKY
jgi:DNA-binding MarR family transcriptional regulator